MNSIRTKHLTLPQFLICCGRYFHTEITICLQLYATYLINKDFNFVPSTLLNYVYTQAHYLKTFENLLQSCIFFFNTTHRIPLFLFCLYVGIYILCPIRSKSDISGIDFLIIPPRPRLYRHFYRRFRDINCQIQLFE